MKRLLFVLTLVGAVFIMIGEPQAVTVGTTSVTLTGAAKYNVSDGNLWYINYWDINLDHDATGAQVLNLDFGDHSTGSGWEKFHIQIHEDYFGTNGHLLQGYSKWWSIDYPISDPRYNQPLSSHGFNAGTVTGVFDIRIGLQQNADDTWTLTPQYRVPTGSGSTTDGSIGGLDIWHTFADGPYASYGAFDLTVLEAFAQVDAGSSGTIEIGGASVNLVPIPSAALLLASGLLGLFGIRRFRNRG